MSLIPNQQQPVALSPEDLAKVDQAVAEMRAGDGITMDAALEKARAHTRQWLESNPNHKTA